MFNIDEKYMEELGILSMPQEARDNLVSGIEESIKNRVLIAIADDLSDFSVQELESMAESNEFAKHWLSKNLPHYAGSNAFKLFSEKANPKEGTTIEQLYAYAKWFEMNVPTFGAVLEDVKSQLKKELLLASGRSETANI